MRVEYRVRQLPRRTTRRPVFNRNSYMWYIHVGKGYPKKAPATAPVLRKKDPLLPFLPSAGAMTADTTEPSGHASAVQPPGRHVERRAWSWSGPLHLPWPSRALKMAKMWSDFGPAAALRGLGGGHDGHPKRHKRHKKTAQHPRENIGSIMHFGGLLETGSKWTIPF